MTTCLNESGNIELSSGKYGPRVKTAAILSPEDLDDLNEEASEAFPARVHHDWFRAEKDDEDLLAPPTFPFLDVLCRKFCGHNWAQVHAAQRDDLRCFDEYLSQVKGCNNRLKGIGNYFTPPQLLTILARGITLTLTAILSEQGIVVDETTTYKAWVTSCRDFEVCFKACLTAADRGGRRGNFGNFNQTSNLSTNSIPPHKRTATSDLVGHPNKHTTGDTSSSTGPFYMQAFSKMPEAMQKEQCKLLGHISACVKCRTAWGSCASNLNKCTGVTLSVPWQPLTNEMVDWAIAAHKSTG
ncbi:hypothetical protein EV359DRAFT_62582 [Lentinula novae-zelandiae]|nr:hypothetical protein EV359DRAFT_62582 [Lentinula novae-zelandiae]